MIGKGATPSFFAIANDNYTLTLRGLTVIIFFNPKVKKMVNKSSF